MGKSVLKVYSRFLIKLKQCEIKLIIITYPEGKSVELLIKLE